MPRVVGISGSLRAGSSNQALLEVAARLCHGCDFVRFDGLDQVPPFNPDLDVADALPAVARWREVLAGADGFLISSPEYAHGVPGALKNALDWTVSSGEFVDKPVLLWTASSSGGEHAHESLARTLRVMSADVLSAASLQTRVARQAFDAEGRVRDAALELSLRASLDQLLGAIQRAREAGASP